MSHTRLEFSRIIGSRLLISVAAIVGMLILGIGLPEHAQSGSLEPAAPPAPTMAEFNKCGDGEAVFLDCLTDEEGEACRDLLLSRQATIACSPLN